MFMRVFAMKKYEEKLKDFLSLRLYIHVSVSSTTLVLYLFDPCNLTYQLSKFLWTWKQDAELQEKMSVVKVDDVNVMQLIMVKTVE